jgi:TRAP-type C4-dicarboxylate transport system permease small subunit
MKDAYIRAMDHLHRLCLFIAIVCLIVMTIIVPWGVFTRYVLNSGSEWPEPMAILLMIVFSFFSAAVCYRDNLHISVMALPDNVSPRTRTILGWCAELGMIATNVFMLVWGVQLVDVTWHQGIAEFPALKVGVTYLPIPIGGTITSLFVIERLWTGALFAQPKGGDVAMTME